MERTEMKLLGSSSGVPPDAVSKRTDEMIVIWNAPVETALEGATRFACLKDGETMFYPEFTTEWETILLDSGVTKVFHNAASSLSQLRQEGIKVNNVQCLSLMAKVLGERYTDLNFLSFKFLEEPLYTDSTALKLDENQLEVTLKSILRLHHVLQSDLVRRNLLEVYIRENRANAIIPRLNCDGLFFWFDEWDRFLDGDRVEISELEASIKTMLDSKDLDLKAPAQVIEALHRAGIKIQSLSEEILNASGSLHPVIPLLQCYRTKSVKIRTFGARLKEHIGSDGRLRGSWNIIGTRSGRMSCVSPPLQAMPGKSKPFFQPEKGNVFVIGDYSQIELRVLAEISDDETLRKQFLDGADLHSGTAALIFKKSIERVSQEERQIGKSLNFGVVYGITAYGILQNLQRNGVDITFEQATLLRCLFLKAYPKVALLQNALLKASTIKTLGGRLWDCNKLTLNQRLNYPIQGTAAEGLKEALILLNPQLKDNWKLCAVVHDEVLLEVPLPDAQEAKTILEQSMIRGMGKLIKSIPIVAETTSNYKWINKEG